MLCDKCWLRHERNRANKRCLDCKQNLCTVCARADEITRPWWIPCWMIQCWRFLFTKAYIPHSIVDLESTENESIHWAHSQEASHVQPIPRVKQSSLRSNKSGASVVTNRSKQAKSRHSSLSKLSDREGFSEFRNRRLVYSHSFDAKERKKPINARRPRRTQSSEELIKRNRRDDLERLKRYNENWEMSFKLAETNEREGHMGRHHCSNKMQGKDVNIEITNDKEIKLTVNTSTDGFTNKSDKHALSKSKSKRKSKDNTPKPYTEEIFEEVPIWFKKSPKHPSNERPKRKSNSQEVRKECDNSTDKNSMKEPMDIGRKLNNQVKNTNNNFRQDNHWPSRDSFNSNTEFFESVNENSEEHSDANVFRRGKPFKTDNRYTGGHNTAYIVEEPPDTCPICLEELPGPEARGLSCSHSIHTKCLITYLYKMDLDFGIRCPLCAQTTIIRNYYAPKQQWYMELPIFTTV